MSSNFIQSLLILMNYLSDIFIYRLILFLLLHIFIYNCFNYDVFLKFALIYLNLALFYFKIWNDSSITFHFFNYYIVIMMSNYPKLELHNLFHATHASICSSITCQLFPFCSLCSVSFLYCWFFH